MVLLAMLNLTMYSNTYVNSYRKQFYALNVQVIGDGQLLIRDLEVRWSGSTHDARIWRNSAAKDIIERQNEFMIVGDSAYPISRTLIKPFRDTPTPQHRKFNKALTGLRTVCTENIIGMLGVITY